jgi:hypothetical protein
MRRTFFDDLFEFAGPTASERMVGEAIGQSAEIVPVRHYSDELAVRGHVPALRRF